MTYCRIKSEEEPCPGYINILYMAHTIMQFSLPLYFFSFIFVYFSLFSPDVDLSIYKIYRSRS